MFGTKIAQTRQDRDFYPFPLASRVRREQGKRLLSALAPTVASVYAGRQGRREEEVRQRRQAGRGPSQTGPRQH